MKKVVVIGAGFAGIEAVKVLAKHNDLIDITLIDQKSEFNFLPMLPDIISKRVDPEYLVLPFEEFSKKIGINFIQDKVIQVKPDEKKVICDNQKVDYDHLLVSTGSVTNFYGNNFIQANAYTLDNVNDAKRLLELIEKNDFENFVVCGGGYTGVEIATNIWRYFVKKKIPGKKIIIVEKAKELLSRLPDWMKQYCNENINKLSIEVITDDEIKSIDKDLIELGSSRKFEKSCLIWAAGVTTGQMIRRSQFKTALQSRVVVDDYLRYDDNCFFAGDAAYFEADKQPLRMGVQFAIAQGNLAAANIICRIKQKKLKAYQPLDLGYIIPMANNKACGLVLGFKVKGIFAIFFHYFMCILRTLSLSNQMGIIKNLFIGQ
jgi:NADH dehydrogenase